MRRPPLFRPPRRRDLAALLFAFGTAATAFALAPAGAAAAPSVKLLPPLTSPVTTYSYRGRVPLDFGVLVTATGGSLELRIRRADYESPFVAWQTDGETGAALQTLPTANLKRGLEGLRRFFRFTITKRGVPVATLYRPLCPNASERTRVSGDGPLEPRYTYSCRSLSPFTKGMVWGIEEGWAVPAFSSESYYSNPRFGSVNLAPGSYKVKVEVMPFFRTFFAIAPEDAEVTLSLRVRKPGVLPVPGEVRASERLRLARAAAAAAGTASAEDLPIDTDPDPSTVPDLSALPAWAISTNHRGTNDYLSFASTGWNAGPAPMVVEGFRAGAAETMDAFQYFYDADGNPISRAPVGTFQFDHRGGHHHWHFLQFVRYSIIDAATNEVVQSFKQSFCLAPTDSIDLTVPGAIYLPYLPSMSSVCGGEEARWLREALPAGWGDTYFQSVAGQAFNITKVPNGSYKIRVAMNPLGLLKEATTSNNVEDRDILLFGHLGARQVIAQPWHGISD